MTSSDSNEPWTFKEAFEAYAKFGDEARNRGRVINGLNIMRWIKASRILTFLELDECDVKEILRQVSKEKPLNYPYFCTFVKILAKVRDVDDGKLEMMLRSCGSPNCQMDLVSFLSLKDTWEYQSAATKFHEKFRK